MSDISRRVFSEASIVHCVKRLRLLKIGGKLAVTNLPGLSCPDKTGPPKELPREVRPFWRRVRSVLERVRNVVEGVAAVGGILVRGGVGCCGVLGTDLALSPCDMGHRRAWETLEEDGRDRNGPGQRSYPCAGRATSVYPNALACLAIVVTLRARYCAS